MMKFLLKTLFTIFSVSALLFVFFTFEGVEQIQKIKNMARQMFLEESRSNPKDSFQVGDFEKTEKDVTSILFVGDMMFDRGVAQHARLYGKNVLFKNLEQLFFGSDIVVGNLEGTITSNSSVAEKNNNILRFTFDPSFAKFLKQSNFTVVSQANNHALDFEKKGYEETKDNLRKEGILSFGSPRNDDNLTVSITKHNKSFCFMGYHDLFTYDPFPVIKEIKEKRVECKKIIIFAHWGEEYQQVANKRQIEVAHLFVDAGADLIIGAHPHVVENMEIYKGAAIFYSLGNFIFDQDISFGTDHGLTVGVEFWEEKTIFTLVPVTIKNREVSISDKIIGGKVLRNLFSRNLPKEIEQQILAESQFILWK